MVIRPCAVVATWRIRLKTAPRIWLLKNRFFPACNFKPRSWYDVVLCPCEKLRMIHKTATGLLKTSLRATCVHNIFADRRLHVFEMTEILRKDTARDDADHSTNGQPKRSSGYVTPCSHWNPGSTPETVVLFYCTHWTAEGSVFGAVILCVKYLKNRWTDLRQIHAEDEFPPSLRRVWRSRSAGRKTAFFGLSATCVRFVFGKTSLAFSFYRATQLC